MIRSRRSAWTWLWLAALAGLVAAIPMTALVALESNVPATPHPWRMLPLIYSVSSALATGVTVAATALALVLRAWSERRSRPFGRKTP